MKFIVKLVLNGIIAVALLTWFTNATFWATAVSSIIFSIIAYWIGDQWILRISNNTVATICDAVMAFVYFWLVAYFRNWDLNIGELIVLSVVLGIAEAVYHRYLASDPEKTAA